MNINRIEFERNIWNQGFSVYIKGLICLYIQPFPVVVWELKNQKCLTEARWDCWKRTSNRSQENYIQKIQKWSIIANIKNFFNFRNKMKIKSLIAMQKELVMINDLHFGSKNCRQHLTWGGWLLEKEEMAVKWPNSKLRQQSKCFICANNSIIERWKNMHFMNMVNPVFLWISQVCYCTIANAAALFKNDKIGWDDQKPESQILELCKA